MNFRTIRSRLEIKPLFFGVNIKISNDAHDGYNTTQSADVAVAHGDVSDIDTKGARELN